MSSTAAKTFDSRKDVYKDLHPLSPLEIVAPHLVGGS